MYASVATITETGQLTVPPEVRRHLGLTAGDLVAFVIGEDEVVRLRPLASATLDALQGSAGSLPQPLSWDEMLETANEDRFARGSKE